MLPRTLGSRLAAVGFVLALGSSFAVGCAGATTAAPGKPGSSSGGEASSAGGVDVAALFAQEQEPQPVHELATPDGKLRARVEATTAPAVTLEDGYYAITAPNGPSAIQCFVYPERKDTAEVMRLLAEVTLAKNVPEHRWVEVHGDQVGGWGYLVARAHYVVESERGRLAGDFKIASSARGSSSVACIFDAPGHYASFERVLRGLLESLDTAENRTRKKPLEAEIVRTRLEGRMVTLSSSEQRKEGGDVLEQDYDASISLGPEGTLSVSDGASTSTFRKGRLVSASYAQAQHGQMDYALQLTSKDDTYTISGTLQDKPFKTEFTLPGGIPASERSDQLVCDVHKGKTPAVELLEYVPDADPAALTPTRIEKSPDAASHLRVTLGKAQSIVMEVLLDDACDFEKGTMRAGEAVIEVERLWSEEAGAAGKKAK